MSKFILLFTQDGNIESKLVAVLAATIYIIIHTTISLSLKASIISFQILTNVITVSVKTEGHALTLTVITDANVAMDTPERTVI